MEIERIKGSQAVEEIGSINSDRITSDNFVTKVTAGENSLYFKDGSVPEGYKVWVVEKNSDFTEGRGPMYVDRIFSEIEDAIEYVLAQQGIYGSKQRLSNRAGVNIHGSPYAYTSFNGYEIKPFSVY